MSTTAIILISVIVTLVAAYALGELLVRFRLTDDERDQA